VRPGWRTQASGTLKRIKRRPVLAKKKENRVSIRPGRANLM
jgi:hypothetical protein